MRWDIVYAAAGPVTGPRIPGWAPILVQPAGVRRPGAMLMPRQSSGENTSWPVYSTTRGQGNRKLKTSCAFPRTRPAGLPVNRCSPVPAGRPRRPRNGSFERASSVSRRPGGARRRRLTIPSHGFERHAVNVEEGHLFWCRSRAPATGVQLFEYSNKKREENRTVGPAGRTGRLEMRMRKTAYKVQTNPGRTARAAAPVPATFDSAPRCPSRPLPDIRAPPPRAARPGGRGGGWGGGGGGGGGAGGCGAWAGGVRRVS